MEKGGFFSRLKEGLSRTRENFARLGELMRGRPTFDQDFYDELEEILLTADVGVATTGKILAQLKGRLRDERVEDAAGARQVLKSIIRGLLPAEAPELKVSAAGPTVVVVVGVNGTGKTTSVGKLAHLLGEDGKKVVLGAADTFRAAAAEQLGIWAQRAGADLVAHQAGSDPAAVAFDAARAALARHADFLLVDTAGRLHTKENLMAELAKIARVLGREIPGAPHEVLLVLDATTGQNALSQARLFGEAAGVTGIVLTKLDGTAKGGVIIAIGDTLGVPVKFVGLGEQAGDLRPFSPEDFVDALFPEETKA
ncbi:MAG: signal recognition particle-docking protein FtsY [Chitinophagales bacterium]